MTNPLQATTNSLIDDIRADMERCQAKVFSGLVVNYAPRQLPESVFRSHFLMAFAGQPTDPNWVAGWISVAGTPSAEVSIVDDSGQELFRVPAMITSSNVILTGRTKGRMSDIFNHVGNLKLNSPQQAIGFMADALGTKSTELPTDVSEVIRQRWIEIFRRYQLIPVEQEASNTEAPTEDFFDYGT